MCEHESLKLIIVREVAQFNKCSFKVVVVELDFAVHVCGVDAGVFPTLNRETLSKMSNQIKGTHIVRFMILMQSFFTTCAPPGRLAMLERVLQCDWYLTLYIAAENWMRIFSPVSHSSRQHSICSKLAYMC